MSMTVLVIVLLLLIASPFQSTRSRKVHSPPLCCLPTVSRFPPLLTPTPPVCPPLGVQIADCCCDAETIDTANDDLLWSRLQSLRATPFFRTFKVNLASTCPFWADEGQCALRGCAVCGECGPDEIESIWGSETSASSAPNSTSTTAPSSLSFPPPSSSFGSTSQSSLGSRVQTGRLGPHFLEWADDDECLWIRQDTDSDERPISYVNLQLNPESYTGYGGDSAHEVWKAIYSENCFTSHRMDDLCYEQRVFYRLLSGMHAAISSHIANNFPVSPDIDVHADINEHPELYGPSLTVFDEKLGQYPDRLNNLYFAFVFLLRAVNKASPMLLSFNYTTGNSVVDDSTRSAVQSLLTSGLIPSCSPSTSFDERQMFSAFDKLPLKSQFKAHFRNISLILDCVGCEKCRLHGKLQLLGLGTALKVLLNDGPFELQRNEVVGLMVTLAKFSHALMIAKQMEERRQWRWWKTVGGGGGSGLLMAGAIALYFWHRRRKMQSKTKQL